LGVALFATAISLAADVTGNDSVFDLVVFAVYGLASVFIPLLLIRMMGYKPDTYHSMTMIIAAFSSVVVWRLLGLDQYIFDTVPGMTAAFTAHLCLCHFRDLSDSAFLGRFEVPRNIMASFGAGLVVLLLVSESLYFINSPDSSSADSMNEIGNWAVSFDESEIVMMEESVTLEDGESYDSLIIVPPMEAYGEIGYVEFDVDCDDTDDPIAGFTDSVEGSSDVSSVEGEFTDQDDDGVCGDGDNGFKMRWDVTPNYIGDDYNASNMSESQLREMWTDGGWGVGTWSVTITAEISSALFDSDEEYEIIWTVVIYDVQLQPIIE
jgi:hypothetical protein